MTTASKTILSKAIGTALKAVDSNPINPLLGNILFESNNGKSRAAATNLEVGISYTFPSQGEAWKTCVPGKVFSSLVDALSAEEVELQQDPNNQSIIIMTESSTSNIHCAPPDEFPVIPIIDSPNFSLPVAQFKELIQRVAFCTATNTATSLEAAQLSIVGKKKLAMFAVDGFHLSYEEAPLFKKFQETEPFLVKGVTLETISRTLPDEGILEVQVAPNRALFHCGNVDVITQLVSGEFPDHEKLKASLAEPKTTVTVQTMELMRAARQLRVLAVERGNSKLELTGMLLRYSVVALDKGDSDITLMAVKQGKDVTIGLSVHLLYEFLEICKTGQITIEIVNDKSPIVFKMPGLESFYHVIMPVVL